MFRKGILPISLLIAIVLTASSAMPAFAFTTRRELQTATQAYIEASQKYEEAAAEQIELQAEVDEIRADLSATATYFYRNNELENFISLVLNATSFEQLRRQWDALDQVVADNIQKKEELQVKIAELEQANADTKKAMEEADAAQQAARENMFTMPCPGYSYISSTFGYRSFDSSFHKGLDLSASQGTPIYAAADGTVTTAEFNSSAGNWVIIDHGNGFVTKYMHMMQQPSVSKGQTVKAGQLLGYVGSTGYSTGAHLHFQVEIDGTAVNPYTYLDL